LGNIKQDYLEFYDFYTNQWNLPDIEGPVMELGTPTYFYMPNHDVIIGQFLGINN